jgi:hypothetical protein
LKQIQVVMRLEADTLPELHMLEFLPLLQVLAATAHCNDNRNIALQMLK